MRVVGARGEGAGGALPPLPLAPITPILAFPHQGGRDLSRGSLSDFLVLRRRRVMVAAQRAKEGFYYRVPQ